MRVADYIAEFIASRPDASKTVFMVSGGGNMHLIDALGRNGKPLSSEVKNDGSIVYKPMEDMYPFLERKEFKKNMTIEPVS